MMLGREPADVADLTQERGRQHRPDAEQLDQAGLGLGNRGLDAGLDGGDSLLQLEGVGHELGGQLPASDPGAPAGVTAASNAAARLVVRLRRAPPGTRSISSRCSRLMV
jgi:hypothetical protein